MKKQNLLKYWCGLSPRLALLALVLGSLLLVSGCGGSPLSLLTGGGPNVAANVQAGKTNQQTVGLTKTVAPSVSIRPNSRVEKIDQSTNQTSNSELPVWVWIVGILLFILGWVTDTPSTVISRFKKKKPPKGSLP